MNKHTQHFDARPSMPRSQRGTMLIIALIVLVAMTLAGIATMRSVDTASLTAGNIAFRQASLNAADQGIQAGYDWLFGKTALALKNDDLPAGYLSSAPLLEPNWSDPANWVGAKKLNFGNPDATGNVVSFIIHRLCRDRNTAPGGTNPCGSTPDPSEYTPSGQDHFRPTYAISKPPTYHYRITARAVGPRNSVSIVQVLLRPY